MGSVGAPDPITKPDLIASLVDKFNALPVEHGVLDCMGGQVDYTLILTYSGVTRAVKTAGCGDLRDATNTMDAFRSGGAEFLADVRSTLAEERETTQFQFTGTDVCDARMLSVFNHVPDGDLSRAVACFDGRPVEVPTGLTTRLVSSFRVGRPRARRDDAQRSAVAGAALPGGRPGLDGRARRSVRLDREGFGLHLGHPGQPQGGPRRRRGTKPPEPSPNETRSASPTSAGKASCRGSASSCAPAPSSRPNCPPLSNSRPVLARRGCAAAGSAGCSSPAPGSR